MYLRKEMNTYRNKNFDMKEIQMTFEKYIRNKKNVEWKDPGLRKRWLKNGEIQYTD